MRNINRGWTLVCCLVAVGAVGALALAPGCGKGESSKSKSQGSASMGSGMGGMGGMDGMGAATPGPKRPGTGPGLANANATATGSQAGVEVWSPKWPKEHKPLYKKFVKAAKKRDYPAALTALAEMKKIAPHMLNVEYKLAYIKALSGDAKGALAHLRVLLFAHYPKYSFKVATDKDLDALKAEPFKTQLDKLLEAARVEHVAAWKKAAFFIGANMRAFKYKRSVRGNQEIYGYVPETGKIVGVTYVDAANTLGYLVTPDKTAMIYVAASKFVSDEGPPAFSDVEVHAISLTTGKRLKVWTHPSHPGGAFHGQVPVVAAATPAAAAKPAAAATPAATATPAAAAKPAAAATPAAAAKPREVKPGDAGVVDLKIEQFKSGTYRLSMEAVGVGDVADKKHTWSFGLTGDAVTAAPPSDKNYLVNHLRVRMCGAKAKRLAWARKIKKDGDTFKVGGKAVTFACAGLVWRSPDAAKVIFQPYRYCRKRPSKLDGLYVVDAAGKFTQVSPKHDAWDITWSGNHHALLQFGGQVGFVNVQTPTFKLLGPPAAHLRAFGPRAIKKCED